MKPQLQKKVDQVAEIKQKLTTSQSCVLIDYRGLSVEEDTNLRRKFRAAGVEYRVLKNTLVWRAAQEIGGLDSLENDLKGPTAIAFGVNDPVAPAKVVTEFINATKKMSVKSGILSGKVVDKAQIKDLAELPSKEVLIAKLMGTLNAPISGLANVMAGTVRQLLYALNAVKDAKQA